jgi:hypothetical protein
MARHIFQACPVWIYTQSNITSILFTWVHYTNTANISIPLVLLYGIHDFPHHIVSRETGQ